jgi:hypothetical protein
MALFIGAHCLRVNLNKTHYPKVHRYAFKVNTPGGDLAEWSQLALWLKSAL